MKKLIALIATLFIYGGVYAQGLGIMAGFTSSKQSMVVMDDGIKHDISDKFDPVKSISFGVNYDFELMENLYLEPGIFYTQKGWMLKGDDGYLKSQIEYLNIPFVAKYRYEVGNDLYITGMGGMEFGLALDGKAIMKIGDEKMSNKLEFGNDEEDDNYTPTDLAIYLGGGVVYKGIEFRLSYIIGIKDVSPQQGLTEKNNTLLIGIGYRFDL